MNETYVPENLCAARRKMDDERFSRDKERIEKTEKLLDKLTECQIQNSEILKNHHEKIADHEKRLDEIEHQPKAWLDKIISGIIAAVVAFVMGVVLK